MKSHLEWQHVQYVDKKAPVTVLHFFVLSKKKINCRKCAGQANVSIQFNETDQAQFTDTCSLARTHRGYPWSSPAPLAHVHESELFLSGGMAP